MGMICPGWTHAEWPDWTVTQQREKEEESWPVRQHLVMSLCHRFFLQLAGQEQRLPFMVRMPVPLLSIGAWPVAAEETLCWARKPAAKRP